MRRSTDGTGDSAPAPVSNSGRSCNAHANWQINVYHDAQHAFTNPDADRYTHAHANTDPHANTDGIADANANANAHTIADTGGDQLDGVVDVYHHQSRQ